MTRDRPARRSSSSKRLSPASFSLKGRKRKLLSSGKNLKTQQKGISLLSLEIIIKSRGFENSPTSSKAHTKI
jgi:hypothetical protein